MKSRALALLLASIMVLAVSTSVEADTSYVVQQDSAVNIWSSANYGTGNLLYMHMDGATPQYSAILDFGTVFETSITSATLQLTDYWSNATTFDLYIAPITQAWEENEVNNVKRTATENWSSSGVQFDAGESITVEITITQAQAWPVVDITSIVQWWEAGNPNYGIMLRAQTTSTATIETKEYGLNTEAVLSVVGTLSTLYTLDVTDGSGDGTYVATADIAIVADAPTTLNWVFDAWTGDTTGITDTAAASTNIIIQTADATINATYVLGTTYALTVTSGSGTGVYLEDAIVNLVADTAPASMIFDAWVGATVADAASAETTITIGTAAVSVTATYASVPLAGTLTFGHGQAGSFAADKIDMVSMDFGGWNSAYGDAEPSDEDLRMGGLSYDANGAATAGFAGLFGIVELFDTLPAADLVVDSATLTLQFEAYPVGGEAVTVSRMLTEWLTGAAGTNQTTVTADSYSGIEWATNPNTVITGLGSGLSPYSFGTADFTTTNQGSIAIVDGVNNIWGSQLDIDVTDVLDDLFASGTNAGFMIEYTGAAMKRIQDSGNNGANWTEDGSGSFAGGPTLVITYHYTGTDTLAVVDGSGSGAYVATAEIAISADAALTVDFVFAEWVGDVTGIADVLAADTTITIQAGAATITATHKFMPIRSALDDGELRTIQWANWQHDGNDWVATYGVDWFADNANYNGLTYAPLRTDVGPGDNGNYDANLPGTTPVSSWNTGFQNDPYVSRPWFTFDLTGISTVGEATLTLTLNSATGTETQTGSVYRMTTAPTATSNWNYDVQGSTTWTAAGGDYDAGTAGTYSVGTAVVNGDTVDIDVTDLVADAIDAFETEISLLLIADPDATPADPTEGQWISIKTLEGAAAGQEPTLTVDTAVTAQYWDGDLNTDEIVNITDLNMVLIDWSKSGGFTDVRSDANGDGTVDIVDLNTVLIDWSKTGFQP